MLRHMIIDIIPFTFGFLITVLLSNFVKLTTGRLRPCFIELCQPDVLQSQCLPKPNNNNNNQLFSNFYIDLFQCTSSEYSDAFARSSFFSCRASMIAYTAVYLICYLQHHMSHLPTFLRALGQLFLLIVTFLLGTSSLFDYHHFWDDVLVGFMVGSAIAFYTYTAIKWYFTQEYDEWKVTSVLLYTHQSPVQNAVFSSRHQRNQQSRDESSSIRQLFRAKSTTVEMTSERTPLIVFTEEWHSLYQTL